ncbi:MAG TPA: hypothetical protein VFV31_02220, partial [Chitinophagaceae bacterium]|nr:hypothetical protein [Chitinophagaceae bacterium]
MKKTVCVIGVLLLLISFSRLYAQCDPTPTVNLKYVSGNGTNCTFNYDFSISYSGNSYKSFQFSVSVNGGAPST